MDNIKCNDEGLRELALFAGAGGGILGGLLLGWRTICAVEYNAYARSVLLARQNDGTLTPFPIWDDVRTFDGNPWRGRVDVVSGGFPCTDISAAGRGAGSKHECNRIRTADNTDRRNGMFDKWPPEPGVGRMVDGMARAVERITALGNGQVPRVAAAAFTILSERLK